MFTYLNHFYNYSAAFSLRTKYIYLPKLAIQYKKGKKRVQVCHSFSFCLKLLSANLRFLSFSFNYFPDITEFRE